MVKRLYVSFVLLLIIAANACAQKITGVVVDAHTGDSIPMAGIVIVHITSWWRQTIVDVFLLTDIMVRNYFLQQ